MATEYVYAIRAGDFVKIGRTSDVRRRLRQISGRHSGCSYPANLSHATPAVVAAWMYGDRWTEEALHDAFAPYATDAREWFHWNEHFAMWCSRRRRGFPVQPGEVVEF